MRNFKKIIFLLFGFYCLGCDGPTSDNNSPDGNGILNSDTSESEKLEETDNFSLNKKVVLSHCLIETEFFKNADGGCKNDITGVVFSSVKLDLSYNEAITRCEGLEEGGFNDWKVLEAYQTRDITTPAKDDLQHILPIVKVFAPTSASFTPTKFFINFWNNGGTIASLGSREKIYDVEKKGKAASICVRTVKDHAERLVNLPRHSSGKLTSVKDKLKLVGEKNAYLVESVRNRIPVVRDNGFVDDMSQTSYELPVGENVALENLDGVTVEIQIGDVFAFVGSRVNVYGSYNLLENRYNKIDKIVLLPSTHGQCTLERSDFVSREGGCLEVSSGRLWHTFYIDEKTKESAVDLAAPVRLYAALSHDKRPPPDRLATIYFSNRSQIGVKEVCENLNSKQIGRYSDWRLPTVAELIDLNQKNAVNAFHGAYVSNSSAASGSTIPISSYGYFGVTNDLQSMRLWAADSKGKPNYTFNIAKQLLTKDLDCVGECGPRLDRTRLDLAREFTNETSISATDPTETSYRSYVSCVRGPKLDESPVDPEKYTNNAIISSEPTVFNQNTKYIEVSIDKSTALPSSINEDNPWHNYAIPSDVDGDKRTSDIDASTILNALKVKTFKDGRLPTEHQKLGTFYDVNNDGIISEIDALIVINILNDVSDK